MQVKLPRKYLKLDPRVNSPPRFKFVCHYHKDGITVTLTRVDNNYDRFVVGGPFTMRIFDPTEEPLPDFNSTVYTILGIDGERAPADIITVIIHPSVKIIQKGTFSGYRKMKRCIFHAKIEAIDESAFRDCVSLEALFLPPCLKSIGRWAFKGCETLSILPLPLNIDHQRIEREVIRDCGTFFSITQIRNYDVLQYFNSSINQARIDDNKRVHQAIVEFHRNLPPLFRACLDFNVSTQAIRECIVTHGVDTAYNTHSYNGIMTPLHILVLNPSATIGSILTCFHANMGAIFENYRDCSHGHDENNISLMGKNPLDVLLEYDLDSFMMVMLALCKYRDENIIN